MDQNILEQRLKAQAQEEAENEFHKIKKEIAHNPIMKEIYKYDCQKDIFDERFVSLLTGMTKENVEAAITKRAEQIYKDKVDDLLRKMDSLQYLFGQ